MSCRHTLQLSRRPIFARRSLLSLATSVTLGACADTITAPPRPTEAPRLSFLGSVSWCGRSAQPDLVVTRIASPTTTLDLNNGSKPLPLLFTIANRGTCAAGTFLIGGAITLPDGFRIDLVFRSTDLGVATSSGRTVASLAAGDSIVVRGEITVSDWVNGQPYVYATVFADDCSPNTTGSCEIVESNETNNRSRAVRVTLAAPSGS